jgi:hypothetical protein
MLINPPRITRNYLRKRSKKTKESGNISCVHGLAESPW